MSDNPTANAQNAQDDNNAGVTRRRSRLRNRAAWAVAILNGLALAACFLGVSYGYRLKTALRMAPFKTIGPLPDTLSNPQFNAQATLNGDGRIITVRGTYNCLPSEGEAVVQALVSQELTGAFARGIFTGGQCTGQVEHFLITGMTPQGTPAFQEGRVKIEALGINRRASNGIELAITDLVFWGRFAMASKTP